MYGTFDKCFDMTKNSTVQAPVFVPSSQTVLIVV